MAALGAGEEWPSEWLGDLNAVYSVLLRHPLGTDQVGRDLFAQVLVHLGALGRSPWAVAGLVRAVLLGFGRLFRESREGRRCDLELRKGPRQPRMFHDPIEPVEERVEGRGLARARGAAEEEQALEVEEDAPDAPQQQAAQMEAQGKQQEIQLKMQEMQTDAQLKAAEMDLKREEIALDREKLRLEAEKLRLEREKMMTEPLRTVQVV